VHKSRVARYGSCLQNSWFRTSSIRELRHPRHRQTSTHSEWLSSRYVSRVAGFTGLYICLLQVLVGETPFRGVPQSAIGHHVLQGRRPSQPENASAIGFSDSLWSFTERCWDGKIELRPEVEEVVTHLKEAVDNWDGLMPPHPRVEDVAPEPAVVSDSEDYSEFGILVLPLLPIEQRCRPTLSIISEPYPGRRPK